MRLALFYFIIAIFSVQQVVPLPFRIDAADNVEIHALQLALELENLEKEFYTLGLNQFNENDFAEAGFSAQVFQRFQEIKEHEEAHAESLAAILGPAAPQPCNYSFPFNDVPTFVNLSVIFESVGASAYTGAMQFLTNPTLREVVSSILAIEARQSSYLGTIIGISPWGEGFETPISPTDAFTLASQFTKSCPSTNPSLGLKPFPALNITGDPIPGQNVTVQRQSDSERPTHVIFLSGLLAKSVLIEKDETVAIPEDVSGQVYAFAISMTNKTIAGPAILLVEKNSNGTLIN